jgi:hypothetical protein
MYSAWFATLQSASCCLSRCCCVALTSVPTDTRPRPYCPPSPTVVYYLMVCA